MKLLCVLLLVTQTGCAGFNARLREWLGGEPLKPKNQLTKFSESGDVLPPVRQQYRRVTKQTLSDEAALDAHAGSLWVNEGQGAYLFSQNIMRLVGDPLAVQLDGDPKDQLTSKVGVIKKLLAKIEAKKNQPANGEAPAPAPEKDKKEKTDEASDLGIKSVPTRIVERTVEGNYRVKGQQPFLISGREYKVIVTGVVRAEDFNDDGLPATKLIDPKFDIVSTRRAEL